MKKYYLITALCFIFLCFSLVTFFLLRSHESSGFWRSYTVLITSNEIPEEKVLTELQNHGFSGIVSKKNSYKGLQNSFSPFEPIFSVQDSYEFFTDKEKTSSLFYIPKKFSSDLQSEIKKGSFSFLCSLDTRQTIPWISFICALLLTLLLFIFSKNKFLFLVMSIPFILYSFCFPFFTHLPSVLAMIYVIFHLQKKYGRTQFSYYFYRHKHTVLLSSFSLLSSLFFSFPLFLLFSLAIASSISAFFFYTNLKIIKDEAKRFVPLLILPAQYTKKEHRVLNFLYLPAAISTIICLFFAFFLFTSNFTHDILLPAPENQNTSPSFTTDSYSTCLESTNYAIPNLAHIITDNWNSLTFPYTSVYTQKPIASRIVPQTTQSITHYELDKEGIKTYDEILFTFDNNFIDSILDCIMSKGSSDIQLVLTSQNTFSQIYYRPLRSGAQEKNWPIKLTLSCLFFVLLILFNFVMKTDIKDAA